MGPDLLVRCGGGGRRARCPGGDVVVANVWAGTHPAAALQPWTVRRRAASIAPGSRNGESVARLDLAAQDVIDALDGAVTFCGPAGAMR